MRWPLSSSPPPVDFEYGAQRVNSRPAEWLLLALSAAFAAEVSWSYINVKHATEALTAEFSSTLALDATSSRRTRYEPGNLETELALARTTLQRIALPWNELFKALSECSVDHVAVLTIEPVADAGTLNLTAEARDVPTMLTYVSRLESNAFFPTVTLTRHAIKKNEPRRPVVFTVVATWKNRH